MKNLIIENKKIWECLPIEWLRRKIFDHSRNYNYLHIYKFNF